ncbi:MAG: FAD-dependent oxidoreductase [Verrucomicrobia bacterium]|nr:FAD-dependent oxidoreductase [Verrucomicrobiota bacterium]
MAAARIIILGGGFAGVKCAKTLRKRLRPSEAEIVLFNKENHLVFSPLLADAVGASLNYSDVVVPLRELLPGVFCRTEEVRRVVPESNEVEFEAEDGSLRRLQFDHLVLACGNVANLNVVPGMADHAFALKTVGDAAVLRTHVLEQLEQAEVCDDPARRRWRLSFAVVGGGYSGVEVAGEINDLVRGAVKLFSNIRAADITVTLVHSRDELLPEIGAALRQFARRKLEAAGVKVLLNARVAIATPQGVGLADGTFINAGTVVCTVGSTTAPVVDRLDTPKEKSRVVTEPDMRVKGRANIWAIGDCAQIINAHDGQPSPPTGQFAERQGRQCAENIARALRRQPTEPFRFKVLGQLCSIGGHCAVAEMFGVQLSGFLAWFVWRGVYLLKTPTWSRRFQISFDWAWLLMFPRDLSHVRTSVTDRVTHAHYAAGDFIFKQGDPRTNFYVIEQGEVEIVRAATDQPAEVIAVLGPGSFFGEHALLNNEPRNTSAHARTAVEVLVMGAGVFTQVSKALAPLRQALATALNRRSLDLRKTLPGAEAILDRTPLAELVEPVPQPLLKPAASMFEVSQAFIEDGHDFFYVSDDGATLDGIVTMTDLVRAQSQGAGRDTPVAEFMVKNPVAICMGDSCATAAATLREHGLKTLPVFAQPDGRKLAGCIRARKLMAHVLRELKV